MLRKMRKRSPTSNCFSKKKIVYVQMSHNDLKPEVCHVRSSNWDRGMLLTGSGFGAELLFLGCWRLNVSHDLNVALVRVNRCRRGRCRPFLTLEQLGWDFGRRRSLLLLRSHQWRSHVTLARATVGDGFCSWFWPGSSFRLGTSLWARAAAGFAFTGFFLGRTFSWEWQQLSSRELKQPFWAQVVSF